MSIDDEDEDYTVEQVTREEYTRIRNAIENGIVEYADNVVFKGICQDEVADFIERIGGIVVYRKKEDKNSITYDYSIGMYLEDKL